LGGVLGTLLCGFVLIAQFGMHQTLIINVTVNFLIGLSTLFVALKTPFATLFKEKVQEEPMDTATPQPYRYEFILFTVFLGGFCALALEVLWSRMLVMFIGSSVYAFSTILAIFLSGLVLGGWLVSRFIDQSQNLLRSLILINLSISIYIFISLLLTTKIPLIFLFLFKITSGNFAALSFIQFLIAAMPLIVPASLMGMALPIASKLYLSRTHNIGFSVGDIYSINAFGSILGPLCVYLIFIPIFGIQMSLLLIGYFYLFCALLLNFGHGHIASVKEWKFKILPTMGLLIILPLFAAPWNLNALSNNTYVYANQYLQGAKQKKFEYSLKNRKVLYYKEGLTANVAVAKKPDGKLVLLINDKPDAGNGFDMETQIILGHLPLLLHGKTDDVLVVGLGSGITAGCVLRHPIKTMDILEIEPAVVEASKFFEKDNYRALEDPRVHMVVDDARHFLRTHNKKYDVITAEPSNPWISSVSKLFTKDQYEVYRQHLKENGIMFQWAHTYGLSRDNLRTLIATFQSVFPYTSFWHTSNGSDLFLVGSMKPQKFNYTDFKNDTQIPAIKKSLKRAALDDPLNLLSAFSLDPLAVAEISKGAQLHTDDRPLLEFAAPKTLFKNTRPGNIALIMKYRQHQNSIFDNLNEEDLAILANYNKGLEFTMLGLIALDEGRSLKEIISLIAIAYRLNPNNQTAKAYIDYIKRVKERALIKNLQFKE